MNGLPLLFSCSVLLAAQLAPGATSDRERLPGPLFDGMGELHHPVTTSVKRAQRYFDQGLTMLFAFNHAEAIRSFRSAARLDPQCGMAYWGVAYAYGPHVNRPMTADDNAEAWKALQTAVSQSGGASEPERAYIRALEKRYQSEHRDDRSELDKAFAAAMRDLVRQYPDDLDAQTLFAEALMDTMPWDYWKGDRSPKPETEEALAALRFVMARQPDHPGANHFYIHAVEAGPQPELGLPAADRLAFYAPKAGHLVHMPSHIYVRVGQYQDAIDANERAVKADRTYLRHCRAQGFYPGAYVPHNQHFLWWAQIFEGRSADAMATARKVADYAFDNYCGPSKSVEAPRLRHLPWLTMARFGQWNSVLAIARPPTTNDFLIDVAVWHFVRGLARVALGHVDEADRELASLRGVVNGDDMKKLDSPAFPASATVAIAERWLSGRVAGAHGDRAAEVRLLEEAVAAADRMPYMEPAYWPLPVRPSLGAALLRANEPARAEKVFRDDLRVWPRNGWGLHGLEESLKAQDRPDLAAVVHRQFEETWANADVDLDLGWY